MDNNEMFASIFLNNGSAKSGQYDAYFHTKRYLRYLWNLRKKNSREVFDKMGYSNYSVFLRRVEGWLNLKKPVPEKFLELIGMDPVVFSMVFEKDLADYEEALYEAVTPAHFSVKLIPGVYGKITVPENSDYYAFMDYVRNYSKSIGKECLINYGGLRCDKVTPDGNVRKTLCKPVYKTRNNLRHFTPMGNNIGTTNIC